MPKKLIVANWKMNGSREKVVHDLARYAANEATNQEHVILALPTPYLYHNINKPGRFQLASQDVSQFHAFGAYTGEISSAMLADLALRYCIIGHSERRGYLGETDAVLAKKLENVLNTQIIPIFCIGEERIVRDNLQYPEFLLNQLEVLLRLNTTVNQLVIAYEPIWAIGTGQIPTANQIAEVMDLIHSFVQKTFPHAKIALLYGGSVNTKNIAEILQISGVDGVLVGGASLKIDEFTAICACA